VPGTHRAQDRAAQPPPASTTWSPRRRPTARYRAARRSRASCRPARRRGFANDLPPRASSETGASAPAPRPRATRPSEPAPAPLAAAPELVGRCLALSGLWCAAAVVLVAPGAEPPPRPARAPALAARAWRCVETLKCVSSDLRAEALRGKTWTLTALRTSRRGGETTNSPRLGRRFPCAGSVNKCKAQDSFARRRPSLVAGVYRLARKAQERCEVEGKRQIDDAELAARPQSEK